MKTVPSRINLLLMPVLIAVSVIGYPGSQLIAAPVVKKGSPVRVESPLNTLAGRVVSDINSSGMHVYAWEAPKPGLSNTGIHVKRTDRMGNQIGSVVLIAPDEARNQTNSSVSIANDGSFVVAYESQRSSGGTELRVARFDASGDLIGEPADYSHGGTYYHFRPIISLNKETKRYAIAYSAGSSISQHTGYWRLIGSDGVALASPISISTTNFTFFPTLAASEGNVIIMAWVERVSANPFTYQIKYKLVDMGELDNLIPPTEVSSVTDVMFPHVHINNKGTGVIAWMEYTTLSPRTIKYRRTNNRGLFVDASPVTLASGIPYQADADSWVSCAINDQGEYGFVWNNNDKIYLKIYDSSAVAVLEEQIAPLLFGPQRGASLRWRNDGLQSVVTWNTAQTGGVYSQTYLVPNNPPVVNPLITTEYYPNPYIQFVITASDPDIYDTLTYALQGSPIPGAYIHPNTGAFQWDPPGYMRGQTIPITFRVTDNGFPPLFTDRTIDIKVLEHQSRISDWTLY